MKVDKLLFSLMTAITQQLRLPHNALQFATTWESQFLHSCILFSWFLFSANRPGRQPSGPLDGPRQRAEKAEALLQVPDPRTRKGVPLQCLRLKTETVGAGPQSQPDGASDQNMVPGLATKINYFFLIFCTNSLICLEGISITPHRGGHSCLLFLPATP